MKFFAVIFTGVGIFIGGVLMSSGWASTPSTEGIAFQSTRLIYNEKNKSGVTFKVSNDTKALYLLQSWVDIWEHSLHEDVTVSVDNASDTLDTSANPAPVVPFIVTPPLERMEVGQATTLRIRLTQKPPMSDRESVYALQIKAIPNQPVESKPKTQKDGVKMMFALQNTVKLFYRPEGLPDYDGQAVASGLQFQRQGDAVVVTNPSVFYVTFNTLSVDGKAVDDSTLFNMVPPKGTLHYPLPIGVTAGKVEWTLINDYGGKTDPLTRPLTISRQP